MKGGRSFILECGLLFSMVVAPALFGSVYPWTFMSLSAFLFFLLFLNPDAVWEVRSLPHFFKWGLLSVFCLILFQGGIVSLNRFVTGQMLVRWLAFAGGFLLIQLVPHSSLIRLSAGLVIVGVLEAAYGLFQVGSGQEAVLWKSKESYVGFVTGTYFNRNHLAGLLELSLGMHWGLWLWCLHKRKLWAAGFLGVLFLVSAIGLLKTGSRMGVASLAVSLVFFTPLLVKEKKSAVLFSFLLLMIGGIAFWLGGGVLETRFVELSENLNSWRGRLSVWRDTLVLLGDYPWWGVGLGNFSWVFPSYQSSELILGWSHAHNDYLELAAELGLPFFTVLILSFSGLWVGCVRRLFSFESSMTPVAGGALISVTSLSVHNLLDFNWAIPANTWMFILLWGIVLRLLSPESHETSHG